MNSKTLPTGAGRPGRPKSEEKRDRIAEAAASLFLHEGFERTSMDRIAQEAGVSKQTVYSHFRSKDELFRNCIAGKIREYSLVLEPDEHDSLESGLRSLAENYLRLLSDPRVVNMWRLVINEAPTHPRVAEMFHQTGPKTTLDSLTAFLEHHREGLVTDECELAARTFLALAGDRYLSDAMLSLVESIPEAERRFHAERVTQQFLELFARA